MQPYIEALRTIITDPGSNLTGFVLLLAAALLLLLILLVLLLILIAPGRENRGRDTSQTEGGDHPLGGRQVPTDRPTLGEGILRTWRAVPATSRILIVGVLITFALSYTYVWTGTNESCASACHVMDNSRSSWESSVHAGVDCVRCHEGAPVLTAPRAALARTRYLVGTMTGRQPETPTIPPTRCLECHGDISRASIETTAGIRMEHLDPIEAGIACEACHTDMGHAVERASRPSRMQICLRCHDNATASAACPTCHVGDVGSQPVYSRMYATTQLPAPTCGGCHDEATCDDCHGLRMPHSLVFIEGDHARPAAFDGKELCWRCHREADCGPCHGDFRTAHGAPQANFKQSHKSLSRTAGCNGCHPNHEGSFCDRCH